MDKSENTHKSVGDCFRELFKKYGDKLPRVKLLTYSHMSASNENPSTGGKAYLGQPIISLGKVDPTPNNNGVLVIKKAKGPKPAFSYDYPRPALTADIIIFRETSHKTPEILLIKRKHEPFENHWALPGGFCDEGETSHEAAIRELFEETGCKTDNLMAVGVFDTPGRDPRGWTVSVAYTGTVPMDTQATAGDDAKEARWFLTDGLPENLAFDHEAIIRKAVQIQNTNR
jgi:8-oxo-dGTP diphosphatase